ncbi:hypothetical protein Hamer_G022045 [Homarus americanus]|uniref:Uncharacterized protein n=1 Tax=Homarus americanus TaxID=6706 RepID=A0A8J5KJX3_HOMAM|nr:hypothetical protein Hamer_G022045 [Homarus americanus]
MKKLTIQVFENGIVIRLTKELLPGSRRILRAHLSTPPSTHPPTHTLIHPPTTTHQTTTPPTTTPPYHPTTTPPYHPTTTPPTTTPPYHPTTTPPTSRTQSLSAQDAGVAPSLALSQGATTSKYHNPEITFLLSSITVECHVEKLSCESTTRPITSTRQPITSTRQPITSTRQPITSTRQPITSTRQPITSTRQPITSTHATSTRRPITSTRRTTAYNITRQPITSTRQPITSTRQPITSTRQPITSRRPITSTTAYNIHTTAYNLHTNIDLLPWPHYLTSTNQGTSNPEMSVPAVGRSPVCLSGGGGACRTYCKRSCGLSSPCHQRPSGYLIHSWGLTTAPALALSFGSPVVYNYLFTIVFRNISNHLKAGSGWVELDRVGSGRVESGRVGVNSSSTQRGNAPTPTSLHLDTLTITPRIKLLYGRPYTWALVHYLMVHQVIVAGKGDEQAIVVFPSTRHGALGVKEPMLSNSHSNWILLERQAISQSHQKVKRGKRSLQGDEEISRSLYPERHDDSGVAVSNIG